MRPKTALGSLFIVAACSPDPDERRLSREALLDPQTCKECHEDHYTEWSASMHAYAADDPVFLAMNARGQRETDGELGDFCVSCHAPMAVREGATTDGLNLDDVPQHLKGVTCYFCHNVEAVEGTHNNPLVLANDTTMRGNFADPVDNPVHDSAYSPALDGRRRESSELCGACHDIVVPGHFSGADADVALERTFTEWKDGLFATDETYLSCARCHMDPVFETPVADFDRVLSRTRHLHLMPAIDVALTPFPPDDPEAERRHTDAVREEINTKLLTARLCVDPVVGIRVELENAAAGHSVPSGAAQDRRIWLEVRAYSRDGSEVYKSGVLEHEGQPVMDLLATDPDLVLLHEEAFDSEGNEAHMFWDIARTESRAIPGVKTTRSVEDGFGREDRTYGYARAPGNVARATLTIRVRPMGLDLLGDLVRSGDLSENILDAMPTFDMLPAGGEVTVEWRSEDQVECAVPRRR
jgi:hypothetical protein